MGKDAGGKDSGSRSGDWLCCGCTSSSSLLRTWEIMAVPEVCACISSHPALEQGWALADWEMLFPA